MLIIFNYVYEFWVSVEVVRELVNCAN